jgi:ADP-heptose:LPS heptosyltransferase
MARRLERRSISPIRIEKVSAMLPHADRIPNVRRIAVLRANAIGDFLLALPALEALRATYPNAAIALLGKRWHHDFLTGRPGPVDRVVVVPPSRGVNDVAGVEENPAEVERFFAAMRRERFDLALQLHGGGRNSNPFVLRLGARVTAGLKTPDGPPLDRWMPYIYFQHETMRYLEAVALVGAVPTTLEARLAVTEADRAESYAVYSGSGGGRPIAAIHPGASDPTRRWPAAKFAAVGDALAAAGAEVVVTGTPDEAAVVAAVVAAMRAPAANLCGRLSLCGLAGLLARSAVLVANDSGPRHLAQAVGTPTAAVYWCFNLVNASPLTRTRHRLCVSWQLDCPVCGADRSRDSCRHQESFVTDVPVEDVAAAALELLAMRRSEESTEQYDEHAALAAW